MSGYFSYAWGDGDTPEGQLREATRQPAGVEGIGLLENITEQIPGVKKIMGDKAYRRLFAEAVKMTELVFETPVRTKGGKGFAVVVERWVADRTFA